jgi:hypothetical protein
MIAVKDAHLLESCVGRWPDFREAEVSGIRLFAPLRQLELDIEVLELLLDAHGIYRDRQRCLTTFSFANVLGARSALFEPFRHGRVLDGLEFAERDPGSPTTSDDWGGRRCRVRLLPTPGFPEAQFFCDEVAILKAISISRAI